MIVARTQTKEHIAGTFLFVSYSYAKVVKEHSMMPSGVH